MIKKDELKPGCWYEGFNRNSAVALWTEEECFLSFRFKLGNYLTETLIHPDDKLINKGFDCFEPRREIRENSPTLEEFRAADEPWLKRAREQKHRDSNNE